MPKAPGVRRPCEPQSRAIRPRFPNPIRSFEGAPSSLANARLMTHASIPGRGQAQEHAGDAPDRIINLEIVRAHRWLRQGSPEGLKARP